MFGIYFSEHQDLRRILTDYGFSEFPLQKTFPVVGFKELIYADFIKATEYRKVTIQSPKSLAVIMKNSKYVTFEKTSLLICFF